MRFWNVWNTLHSMSKRLLLRVNGDKVALTPPLRDEFVRFATVVEQLHGKLTSGFVEMVYTVRTEVAKDEVVFWHRKNGDPVLPNKSQIRNFVRSVASFSAAAEKANLLVDRSPLSNKPSPVQQLPDGSYCLTIDDDKSTDKRHALHSPKVDPPAAVVLKGRGQPVIVLGHEKPALTRLQYKLIEAILKAEPDGLTKDDIESMCGSARRILTNLKTQDADWAKVIHSGKAGRRYRIYASVNDAGLGSYDAVSNE